MKIIKQTFDQLILEKKIGWNFFPIIVGLFCGGMPLFITLLVRSKKLLTFKFFY